MFAVLLGVYQLLLYRYTGQRDILVGTAMAGRENVDMEEVLHPTISIFLSIYIFIYYYYVGFVLVNIVAFVYWENPFFYFLPQCSTSS